MSRPYRLQGENCCYHITSRGNDRQKIFTSEYDYERFLGYIHQAREKYHFYLYAYVLLSNHYHLLVETTEPNLSRIMHYINSAYTTYHNLKRNKCGHLFQGRYKSILIDKDSYLLELTRYIHLNPVRAGIVQTPEGYKWSSYLEYSNKTESKYIDKEQLNQMISLSPAPYKCFVEEGIEGKSNPFEKVYAGFILGKTSFIKEKLRDLKEQVESKDFSFRGEIQERIGIEEIAGIIEQNYHKTMADLRALKKRPVKEKKVAIYLLKRFSNLSNREIGKEFDISYSAVSKVVSSVEKQRQEDKQFREELGNIISHFKG